MNPELLEAEELEYELKLRGIRDVSTKRSKTSALSKILSDEEKGICEFPSKLPSDFDIEEEFKICSNGSSNVLTNLRQAIMEQNAWEVSKGRARLIHYQNRIGRLEPVNSFTLNTKNSAVAKIQECSLLLNDSVRKTPKNPSAPKNVLGAIAKLPMPKNQINVSSNQWGEAIYGGARSNVPHKDRTGLNFGDLPSRLPIPSKEPFPAEARIPTSSRIENLVGNRMDHRNRVIENLDLMDNLSGIRLNTHPDHCNSRANAFDDVQARGSQEFIAKRKPIPVHLWKASFSGEGDLHDFISQIDMFKLWEKTSDEDLLSSIGYLLTGRAAKWFRIHFRDFQSWTGLKEAMKKEFLPSHSAYKLIEDIDKRYQKKDETFGEYLDAMLLMFSYMSFPLSEEHKLYMIRKNMERNYSIALSSQVITSIGQLAEICKRMDDTKNMIDNRDNKSSECSVKLPPAPRDYRRVNNICEMDPDEREIMALEQIADHPNTRFALARKDNNERRPQQNCWNCSKIGHNFNFCPDPISKFFCFRCGKPDVSSRRCPICNKASGNDPARI